MSLNQVGLGLHFVAEDAASPVIKHLNLVIDALDNSITRLGNNYRSVAGVQKQFARSAGRLGEGGVGSKAGKVRAGAAAASVGGNLAATKANTKAMSSGLGEAALAANSLTSNVGTLAARFGPLAAGVGGVALAFKAANAAGNFNQQLVAAQKIMGATTAELKQLESTILDVAIRTKFSPDEIVEGVKNLGSAGLTAAESMSAIEPAALLATAGQIGIDEASRAVVGTLRSFSLEASHAQEIADKLARTTQLSNLQAADFDVGLAKASATMGSFGQSLDDTLVGLGALRNANIDASSASTALRESARRVFSDSAVRNNLKGLGLDVDALSESQHGLIDAVFGVDDATKNLTKSQRDAKVAAIFGAEGLQAFNAISKLTYKTTRDGQEVLLKGRDAFAAMRNEVSSSEGTVKSFNDALLDTFEGQKTILAGSIDTFKVVFGQGFAKALKPLVKFASDVLGSVIAYIKDMAPQSKEAVAKFISVLAGIGTALGVITVIGAPIAAAIAGVVSALVVLSRVIDTNVGGIKDSLQKTFGSVLLFFKGFAQLITDGYLSGDTLANLQKKENSGVLAALSTLVQAGHRIMKFFEGIGEGFTAGLKGLSPLFDRISQSVSDLGVALGITGGDMSKITTPSETFVSVGTKVGQFLSILIGVVGWAFENFLKFTSGLASGFSFAWGIVGPIFDSLWGSLTTLWGSFQSLFEALGVGMGDIDETGGVMKTLGKIIGTLVTVAVTPLAIAFDTVATVLNVVVVVVTKVINFFKKLKDIAFEVIDVFKNNMPDALSSTVDLISTAYGGISDAVGGTLSGISDTIAEFNPFGDGPGASANNSPAPAAAAAAAADVAATASVRGGFMENVSRIAQEFAAAGAKSKQDGPPTVVQVFMDSEQIATAVSKGQRSAAASAFGG